MKSRDKKQEADLGSTLPRLPDWRNVVGMERNISELETLLASKYAHPVLLLQGPRGFGKRHLATWIAARHLCVSNSACGHCADCREVLAGIHPDLLVVDEPEESSIRTAELEELQGSLDILSPKGLRVAVITNCDRMTPEAANRMLKTLEEPPHQARFILTTSRPKALLPTVLGRCLKWKVSAPEILVLLPWFRRKLEEHGRVIESDEFLVTWIRRAGYSPGLLLSQLEDRTDSLAAISDRVRSLLQARQPQEVLRMAEELARTSRLSIMDFLSAQEWELNDSYRRQRCGESLRVIAERRDMIARLRRLGGFGRVYLNTQLAAESIGLLPFAKISGDHEWHR